MKKRLIALTALMAVLLSAASCAAGKSSEKTDASSDTAAQTTIAEETTENNGPEVPELNFEGASFTFGVVDNANAKNQIVVEEQTGDILNDAQYETIARVKEKLNADVKEYVLTKGYPAASSLVPLILAGDDAIQVANVFCVDAPTLMADGYVTDYSNIPYIDLEKPYWDKNVTDAMMIGDTRYAAIGDLSISTHDLSYILVFSKSQIETNGFDSPYELVKNGTWTMDNMAVMMEGVTSDVDGDGVMTISDNYGYAGHSKMVLPSFWTGAGEKSIEIGADGVPALAMNDERFMSVINKIFAITLDNGARYSAKDCDKGFDVPDASLTLFKENRVLFMDCSLFYVASLRDMDNDFGMLPYPKYDEQQDGYHARVSYYMPPIIPVTNVNYELTGAVLELANAYAYELIRPAYYDISLKGKVSRDTESVEMLDLILANRVVDLGDTLFCAKIRDGFVYTMYQSNKRDLASIVAKQEESVNKTIREMLGME